MHPHSRAERRHVREVARNARRRIMKSWYTVRKELEYLTTNIMWWAGKQAVAHGNRCSCNIEKINEKRKRREALKHAGELEYGC